jgi:hypothetical protein
MPVTINVNRLSLMHEASGSVSAAIPNICRDADDRPRGYRAQYSHPISPGGTRDVVAGGAARSPCVDHLRGALGR